MHLLISTLGLWICRILLVIGIVTAALLERGLPLLALVMLFVLSAFCEDDPEPKEEEEEESYEDNP